MKILLINLGESRCEYLKDALTKKYKLKYLDDPYLFLHDEDTKYTAEHIIDATNKIKTQENLIVKIHAYNILFSNGKHRYFPIELYNIPMYDKVYITVRDNLVEHILSIILSHRKRGKYNLDSILYFNPSIHHTTCMMVLRMIINLQLIENFLMLLGKSFTKTYYETIERYVNDELKVKDVEIHKSLPLENFISNYSDLEKFVKSLFGTTSYDEFVGKVYGEK